MTPTDTEPGRSIAVDMYIAATLRKIIIPGERPLVGVLGIGGRPSRTLDDSGRRITWPAPVFFETAERLAATFGPDGFELIGVDNNHHVVEGAGRHLEQLKEAGFAWPHVEIVYGDFAALANTRPNQTHIVTAINVLYHYNVEERSRARQLLGRALREGGELVEGDGFVFATSVKEGDVFAPSAVHLYLDLNHMDFVMKFGMAVPDIDVSGLEHEFSYAMQNIKISGLDAVVAADFLTKALNKAGFKAGHHIPGIVSVSSSPVGQTLIVRRWRMKNRSWIHGLSWPGPDFISLDDEESSFKLRFTKLFKELKSTPADFFFSHIVHINNNDSKGVSDGESENIAKVFVEGKKNGFLFGGVVEYINIGGLLKLNIAGVLDLDAGVFKVRNKILMYALVGEDGHLRRRDNFRWMFHRLGGILNRRNHIIFGNPGILTGDVTQGISAGDEREDVTDRYARTFDAGFPESDERIDRNFLMHYVRSLFLLKNNIFSEYGQVPSMITILGVSSSLDRRGTSFGGVYTSPLGEAGAKGGAPRRFTLFLLKNLKKRRVPPRVLRS